MSWPQLLSCVGILFSLKSCRLVSKGNNTVCLNNNMERHTFGYEKHYLHIHSGAHEMFNGQGKCPINWSEWFLWFYGSGDP